MHTIYAFFIQCYKNKPKLCIGFVLLIEMLDTRDKQFGSVCVYQNCLVITEGYIVYATYETFEQM